MSSPAWCTAKRRPKRPRTAARALFGGAGRQLSTCPPLSSPKTDLTDGKIGLLDLMLKTGLVPSKREARQLIQQGGVMLNGEKVTDTALYLGEEALREGVILKKGKKVYHKAVL